jgi:peptidyl-prolyl cis-trans isomerase SurA
MKSLSLMPPRGWLGQGWWLGLVLGLPFTASSEPLKLDRVIAIVNSEPITASELRQSARIAERQLQQQGVTLPDAAELDRQVLERLILDRAQVQTAREQGLRVDDAQVERSIARIAEENGVSVSAFRDQLEAEGVSFERFRADMRDNILMSRLREREVDSRIAISEAEIEAQVAAARKARPIELKIAQILLGVPENATSEQLESSRLKAEGLAVRARAGGDFAVLAASSSEAAGAAETGGSLGWREAERWPSLFVDAMRGQKAGAIVGPVRSGAGFHVLKLEDLRSAETDRDRPVVQNRASHILIRAAGSATEEIQTQRLLKDLRDRAVARTDDFADLARQHSIDGSAPRGGDLGWLDPGDTVPEFDQAMQALTVGEISQPVRSQFGWHLILLNERRTGSAETRERLIARNALREKKAREQVQEWLQRLRDRAFVELRLD